jgi:hypothetical protein
LAPDFPVTLLSELDSDRWEMRKIEFYADGTVGYADPQTEVGGSFLGEVTVPEVAEMNSDPQFEAVEISLEEFERNWMRAEGLPVREEDSGRA